MRTAILDPFSGISGDMTLGALIGVGLDPEWLRALPERMGLPQVSVDIREVLPGGLRQRGHVLPLERERRALRVVFVVGAGALRRVDDAAELTLERGQPGHRALARGGQHRACIFWIRHHSCLPAPRAAGLVSRGPLPSGRLGTWQMN